MAQRRWRPGAALVVATVLVASCSAPGGDVDLATAGSATVRGPAWPVADPSSGPSWPVRGAGWPRAVAAAPVPVRLDWPSGVEAPLEPTGLDLVGGSGEGGVAVDGAGNVWVDGPWQVARVDPRSGVAEVWDAGDDAAFATVELVAASATAGVWLVAPDRVRLFDGSRFVVDLAVPPEYRGGSGVRAMAERGAEVWVGTDAGVARWSEGEWTVLGLGQVSDVVAMAVDVEGTVWVSGHIRTSRGVRRGVAVFDGRGWVVPAEASAPFALFEEIEADPTGGVVVRAGTLQSRRLHRYEAGVWTDLAPGLAETRPGELGDDAVAVGPDGRVWVAGAAGVASRGRYGAWEEVDSEGWPQPVAGRSTVSGVAHVAGTLVAADRRGLLWLEQAGFTRLWTDPALPSGDIDWDGQLQPGLLALSAREAWVDYRPLGLWLPLAVRHSPQGWSTTDPPETTYGDDGLAGMPVRATDGALWQITAAGLARFDGRGWAVVDPSVVGAGFAGSSRWAASPFLRGTGLPGPEGSIWLWSAEDADGVVEVRPDGGRDRIDLPGGSVAADVRAVAGAPGGSFWVVVAGLGAVPREGDRWGEPVPLPTGMAVALEAAVSDDGALWATLLPVAAGAPQVLGRLEGGRWEVRDQELVGLAPVGTGICGVRGREFWGWGPVQVDQPARIVCLAPGGRVDEVVLPVPVQAAAVARDGGVWVVGEQLARLPDRVGVGR